MGRNKKDVFVHQLKTLANISERAQVLIDTHRGLKTGKLGVMFRTVIEPNGPTIYEKGFHGKGGLQEGVRECDYKFSASDPGMIEASEKHGLSFSSTVKHTMETLEFLGGFQKKGKIIKCAYWILENNDAIPEGLKFVKDPKKKGHYLLCVTERIHVYQLVEKLNFIAQRMAIMTDLPLEAYKNA
jgi:hypothetical protein